MRRQLALISIIVIFSLIILFWFHNLKFTLSSLPPLKEEKFFSLFKESFEKTKNIIKVPTSTIENFFLMTTSTPVVKQSLLRGAAETTSTPPRSETSPGSETDQEILTKEQIEILKDKIKNLNEEKK